MKKPRFPRRGFLPRLGRCSLIHPSTLYSPKGRPAALREGYPSAMLSRSRCQAGKSALVWGMLWAQVVSVTAGSWAVIMTGLFIQLRRRHLALRKHYRTLLREREQLRFDRSTTA